MKKMKFVLLVVIVYLAGFFTGICMQNVNAVVRAPNENNQPTSSQTAYNNPAPQPMPQSTEVQQQNQVQNPVPNPAYADRPMSPPSAADDRGATLYSLSSSMRVDIQRLEEDLALLKNKVNILNNMR